MPSQYEVRIVYNDPPDKIFKVIEEVLAEQSLAIPLGTMWWEVTEKNRNGLSIKAKAIYKGIMSPFNNLIIEPTSYVFNAFIRNDGQGSMVILRISFLLTFSWIANGICQRGVEDILAEIRKKMACDSIVHFCGQCGSQVKGEEVFCSNCGTKINDAICSNIKK